MSLILPNQLRRNSLAYPGRSPGFDPNHIALASGGRCRFSGVAMGPGFVNLLAGQGGTNATVTQKVLAYLGNTLGYASGTSATSFTGQSTANDTVLTLAGIFSVTTVASTYQAIFGTGSGAGFMLAVMPIQQFGFYDGSDTNSGIIASANTPYFYVASINGTTKANFLILNLATGQIVTAAVTPGGAGSASNGTYVIGNWNLSSNALTGNVAATAFITNYLSMDELQLWALDPWSFWYPHTEFLSLNWLGAPVAAGAPANTFFPFGQLGSVIRESSIIAS